MKQMIVKFSIPCLILTGCVTTEPFYHKSGASAEVITCSSHTWLPCLKTASSVCGEGGYEILEKTSNKVNSFFTNSDYKEMIIVCKNKKGGSTAITPKEEKPTTPLSTSKNSELSSNNIATASDIKKIQIDNITEVDMTNKTNQPDSKIEDKKEESKAKLN